MERPARIAGLIPHARDADHARAWRNPSSGGASRRKVRGAWLFSGPAEVGVVHGAARLRRSGPANRDARRGEEGRRRKEC